MRQMQPETLPKNTTTPICSSWSEWTNCSAVVPCSVGSRTRTKSCTSENEFESEPCVADCVSTPVCIPPMVFWNCSNCPSTCKDYRLPETCSDPDQCEPGCACPPGQVLYDGVCIPSIQCPCYNDAGDEVPEGFTYGKSKCEECVCISGSFNCYKKADCCEWSDWGPWGECSDDCQAGIQSKYRQLTDGNPDTCGDNVLTETCTPTIVPGTCVDCVHNNQFYSVGDIISVQDGGCTICYCDSTHGVFCKKDPLAIVDGYWSGWSEWSTCSTSCEGGNRRRTRQCNDPLASCDGKPCNGTNVQTENCHSNISCCTTTDWNEWTDCSVTCGTGQQARTRSFIEAVDQNTCIGINNTDIQLCDKPNCACDYDTWTEWSVCTVSCGIGITRRTQDILVQNVDCPTVNTESKECYLEDCLCDKNHTSWSNHTKCESTCVDRFNSLPVEDCQEIDEGCICDVGYYLNQLGECVKEENCSICYIPEPKQPGETWINPNNTCELCECLDGMTRCTEKCQKPVCAADEELHYDPNNPCCPTCKPTQTHCTLHTDFRVVESGECITTQPIYVSYCSGACGNSSSIPLLIISGDQTGNNGVQQDCKCCTGTVASIQTVGVICGPNKVSATAQIASMSSCSCDECIQLDSQAPSR